MESFPENRNIPLRNIPPSHSSSSPVKILMCPLGKTMKISHLHNHSEKEHLKFLEKLQSYATPSNKRSSNSHAKQQDLKQENTYRLKTTEYKKEHGIREKDKVQMRNISKLGNSDPIFLPDPHTVILLWSKTVRICNIENPQRLCKASL